MGATLVELRCPEALDPRPSRPLDVLSEPEANRRAAPPEWASGVSAREKAFVMRVEEDDSSDDDEVRGLVVAKGARFLCDDPRYCDFEESVDELDGRVVPYQLMEQRSLEKSILFELEHEHHFEVQEELTSKLAALQLFHQNEIQKTISAFARLQKYIESRKEIDRRLDIHFQRKIAKVLDRYLSMVQRDHEQKSQIVERRIRDDADIEEASTSNQISQNSVAGTTTLSMDDMKSELPGIKIFADNSALEESRRRRALHDQVLVNIHLTKEFGKFDRQIGKSISRLMPTTESVKARAIEIVKALDGQDCPRPIACCLFAKKIISIVKSRNTKDKTFGKLAFACGYVMLLVTSQMRWIIFLLSSTKFAYIQFQSICML